jgi:hypothetical protein
MVLPTGPRELGYLHTGSLEGINPQILVSTYAVYFLFSLTSQGGRRPTNVFLLNNQSGSSTIFLSGDKWLQSGMFVRTFCQGGHGNSWSVTPHHERHCVLRSAVYYFCFLALDPKVKRSPSLRIRETLQRMLMYTCFFLKLFLWEYVKLHMARDSHEIYTHTCKYFDHIHSVTLSYRLLPPPSSFPFPHTSSPPVMFMTLVFLSFSPHPHK